LIGWGALGQSLKCHFFSGDPTLLLRATLTTPAVTADLVRQALQDQTTELTAVLSAAASRRPRVVVVIPPEDVKDGVLEADGLQ